MGQLDLEANLIEENVQKRGRSSRCGNHGRQCLWIETIACNRQSSHPLSLHAAVSATVLYLDGKFMENMLLSKFYRIKIKIFWL